MATTILVAIGSLMIGFGIANLIRLDKVGKELNNLSLEDSDFDAKIQTIRKFNYHII